MLIKEFLLLSDFLKYMILCEKVNIEQTIICFIVCRCIVAHKILVLFFNFKVALLIILRVS